MGKAQRLKAIKKAQGPKLIGTIAINVFSDGSVKVGTPSLDSAFIGNALGKAIHALIQANVQQAKKGNENRIVTPGKGLMLPH